MDKTAVRVRWDRVWTHGSAKTHLDPSCPHVTDRHHAVPTDDLPESHIDVCEWCEERYTDPPEEDSPDTPTCERCGERVTDARYCVDCATTIAKRRARRV